MKNLKNTILLAMITTVVGVYTSTAQGKYIDKNAILDTETNKIASLALVKGFRFKNSLMQEHFNENYIESDTYPKATFKGKLLNFDSSKLTESPSDIPVDGTLGLHGKEKDIRTTLSVRKVEDAIIMEGGF